MIVKFSDLFFTLLLILALFTPVSGQAATSYNHAPIFPETTTTVFLSAKDVNRISCPSHIQDLIFSTEKNIESKFVDKDVFIKFKVLKKGNDVEYQTDSAEFFVVCGDSVYTLIATPDPKLDAVTIPLASPQEDSIKQNLSLYEGLPLEKKVLQLIREAYTNEIPASYTIKPSNRIINLSGSLSVMERKIIEVDGQGLRLCELLVRNVQGVPVMTSNEPESIHPAGSVDTDGSLDLIETDFLTNSIGSNILAVSMADQHLSPGQATRVFVVFQKNGEDI